MQHQHVSRQMKRHNQSRGQGTGWKRAVWEKQSKLFKWVQIRKIGLAQEEKGLWLNFLHIKFCTFVWFQNIFILKLNLLLVCFYIKGLNNLKN